RGSVVPAEALEVLEVGAGEARRADRLDHRSEPARDGEAAAERVPPEQQVEDRLVLLAPRLPVRVRHRELVEVRQERQRLAVQPVDERSIGHTGNIVYEVHLVKKAARRRLSYDRAR